METVVGNHVITGDVDEYPETLHQYRNILRDRSMLVRKAEVFPIECIVRSYLSESGWKSYWETDEICGIKLPSGLKESEQLSEPIFTPSTKQHLDMMRTLVLNKCRRLLEGITCNN